jgi:ABC-type amino acid transport substrate-binding protein
MALVTEEERRVINRRWIASTGEESETLIIAINRAYAPLSFINALGRPSGLFVDMWRTWAEETGRQIQFRPTGWNETLDGLRAGEADIHSGLSFSTKQEEWIDYTNQIYETYTRAYHRINEDLPADIDAYDNRVIGVGFNTYQEERLRKEHPEANIRSYGSNQELIDALLKGEIDAIVQEEQLMEAELDRLGVRAEIAARPERLYPSTIHAGILKGKPELLAQINDGFGAIAKETLAGLEKRWISDTENHFYRPGSKAIILSANEKAWLSKHPVLRLSNETDFPPFDFTIDGKPSGLSIDIMNLLAQKLGLSTQYVTGPAWNEFLNMLENGEIDVIHTIYESEERKKRFDFTSNYYFMNVIGIFTLKENNSIRNLADLKGKTVAYPEGYTLVPVLKRENPDVKIVYVDTMVDAIKALSDGEIDAVVETLRLPALWILSTTRRMTTRLKWLLKRTILTWLLSSTRRFSQSVMKRLWGLGASGLAAHCRDNLKAFPKSISLKRKKPGLLIIRR